MNSLRRQLTRTLLKVLSLLLGLALVAIYLMVWRDLLRAWDLALQSRAGVVSAVVEFKDGHYEFEFSDDFLAGYGRAKPRNYFQLWDATGASLARSPSLRDANLSIEISDEKGGPKYWNLTAPNGRSARAIYTTFRPETPGQHPSPKDTPTVTLVVAVDREDLDETLAGLLAAVCGCGALLFAAVWFLVPLVLRRGLVSLDRLAADVARIDARSLAAPLAVADLPTELRPVGDRLNELLARLGSSFERERRFSADLAHELRTPLTELRSLAECALKWPESRGPANDREVLEIAQQMEALVTRMLALARGENGKLATNLEPTQIAEVVTATWRTFAARASGRGLQVEISLVPASVSADPVLLRGLLGNLFDNAVAYAPGEATLRITGACQGEVGGYRLQISNPADDLTPDDLARLFERFWRKEAARSGGGEHTGLGLSLAQMFAAAMGWRLSAALEPGGWLTFTLEAGENSLRAPVA